MSFPFFPLGVASHVRIHFSELGRSGQAAPTGPQTLYTLCTMDAVLKSEIRYKIWLIYFNQIKIVLTVCFHEVHSHDILAQIVVCSMNSSR